MAKIVGGAFKLPDIFQLQGVSQHAKIMVKAPDGSQHEITIEIKMFEQEEFFESIDKFKEQALQS